MAGYEREIDIMLQGNPGLRSRTVKIHFADFDQDQCVEVFLLMLKKLKGEYKLSAAAERDLPTFMGDLLATFGAAYDFGNGRSVENYLFLVKDAYLQRTARRSEPISTADLQNAWEEYVARYSPSGGESKRSPPTQGDFKGQGQGQSRSSAQPSFVHGHSHTHDRSSQKSAENDSSIDAVRDANTTDEQWAQVVQALEERKRQQAAMEALRLAAEEARRKAEEAKRAADEAKRRQAAAQEQKRLQELARQAQERARKAREAERAKQAELERQRIAQQKIERLEKLKRISKCVQGFEWLKVSGGYRCAGGSHFVTDAQLASV